MRLTAANFVPRLLSNDQRDHRVMVRTELQKAVRHDSNFLSRVIFVDESWLYDYDPEKKQQSSQWKTPSSPRLKKSAPSSQQHQANADLFFSPQELCIRSLFHLVRLSMESFTARF